MDDRMRALLAEARARGERVPDDDDEPMVLAWLASPGPHDPPGVGRYLTRLWHERADLRETFPGLWLDPAQRAEYLTWASVFAPQECGLPDVLLPRTIPPDPRAPFDSTTRGVTVVGHVRAVLGIGAAARRMTTLLRRTGERIHVRAYDHHDAPDVDLTQDPTDDDRCGETAPDLDLALLCVNGAQQPRLARALGPRALAGRHRIGLWFWELAALPPEQAAGFAHVDEVWVTSDHTRDAVLEAAPPGLPVHVVPLGTTLLPLEPADGVRVRARLGVPESARLVGFTFDHASRLARKNPVAVIDAYCRAVSRPDPATTCLVIKSVNAATFPRQHRALLDAAAGRADVIVVDANLDERDQQAFVAGLAAYVSLHRAEGYGLTLLEAMARRVPVVATGCSGNLAFMDVDNSWLVPYDVVRVASDDHDEGDPYARLPPGATWADPDVDEAAASLREILVGGTAVDAKVARAHRDAAPLVDGSAAVDWIRGRLDAIRADRA